MHGHTSWSFNILAAVLTYLRSTGVSAILKATDDQSYALRDMQAIRVTVSSVSAMISTLRKRERCGGTSDLHL